MDYMESMIKMLEGVKKHNVALQAEVNKQDREIKDLHDKIKSMFDGSNEEESGF